MQFIECGFDYARYGKKYREVDLYTKFFHKVRGTNLRLMIYNRLLHGSQQDVKSFVDLFKFNPNLGAWQLGDEPKYSQLNSWADAAKKIKDAQVDVLYSVPIYINLCPVKSDEWTGENTTYREYLDEVYSLFDPRIWSFDYYPVYQVKNTEESKIRLEFYDRLNVFKNVSKETYVPFWSYCRTKEVHFLDGRSWFYPAPTLSSMQFSVFTALAFGAQGIVFWTYGQRNNNDSETYANAPIDRDGNKTEIWYLVKNIISQIRKYNDVFIGCTFVECKYTGDTEIECLDKLEGGIGAFNSIVSQESGVFVSQIWQRYRKYDTSTELLRSTYHLIVVNRDVLNSQEVTFTLKDNYEVEEITLTEIGYNAGTTIKRTLEPGGYIIFRWRHNVIV